MSNANQRLYTQIKNDILSGKLAGNKVLKQTELAEFYGVSRIPIRDTLLQLKNESWLVRHGKKGLRVAPLNAGEAEDLYQMRALLEPLILEKAFANINRQILGKAGDISQEIRSNQDLSANELGLLNWEFHSTLYACAQRDTLFATIEQLHAKCARYIGHHNGELAYLDKSETEHEALLTAIDNGAFKNALSILKAHIEKAGVLLVEHLKYQNTITK
jgi:DNA-binding GntR family transcriptional regulator